jgi:hypothetical protein
MANFIVTTAGSAFFVPPGTTFQLPPFSEAADVIVIKAGAMFENIRVIVPPGPRDQDLVVELANISLGFVFVGIETTTFGVAPTERLHMVWEAWNNSWRVSALKIGRPVLDVL